MLKGLRLGIVGPGLIGGSIALRARSLGAETIGWEPDAAKLRRALELGLIVETAASLGGLAGACDVLVLAAPLDATIAHIAELRGRTRRAPLVIDVGSVKAAVVRAAAGMTGFVATHPIAGSERSGPSAARSDLFEGKTWTYDASAAPDGAQQVCTFIEAMGARPFAVDSQEHDRIVALTSHLPQLVSVVLGARLAGRIEEPEVAALCGTGIASMLRLAKSDWRVWEPIFASNASAIAQEVRELATILKDAAEALDSGSLARLGPVFHSAARAATTLEANTLPQPNVDS